MKKRQAFVISLRVELGEGKRLGPGKIRLLEEIAKLGSISAAGRALNMSYKRAWDLAEESNTLFDRDVVTRKTGGQKGGGAVLTEFGDALVKHYRVAEAASTVAVKKAIVALAKKK